MSNNSLGRRTVEWRTALRRRVNLPVRWGRPVGQRLMHGDALAVQRQFAEFTMIPPRSFVDNLELARTIRQLDGDVIECGVWRGGMIAGIAAVLGADRRYVLFDSFEGLPPAQEIDGCSALAWQANKESPAYYENCSAEEAWARSAMARAGVTNPELQRGWFADTVPAFAATGSPIALLRLDGDWYDSTMVCLEHLFPLVADGGLVIIDDYGTWDGCTRAVHRYLADDLRTEAIRVTAGGVTFLRKGSKP